MHVNRCIGTHTHVRIHALNHKTLSLDAQFPHCEDGKKISVSCLDLCYTVKWKRRKEFKDEKKDETSPVILHGLMEEEESNKGPLSRLDSDSSTVSW